MPKVFISTSSFAVSDASPLEILQQHHCDYEINPLQRTLKEDEIIQFLRDKDGLIAGVEPLTKNVLQASPKLKVISRVGIGMENIDIEYATGQGIKVYNTPDGPTAAVVELTLGLILSLLRNTHQADREIREGKWKKRMGNLLYQRKIGIIGFGRIGKRLAQLLTPFLCEILVYDPFVCEKYRDITYAESLEELVNYAEVITLHVPYSEKLHHLIDKKMLEVMNQGTILINTSRGGLIDEKALYHALQNGTIRAAAIDTFEQEPYSGELIGLPNVILLPHIGSYAHESRILMEMEATRHLLQGFAGHGLD